MQIALNLFTDTVTLPKYDIKPVVPPIKCQGIKTKLVPFILSSIRWDGKGRWIEPFLGSGVVLFSLVPKRAFVCDTNVHIIRFYRDIADGVLTSNRAREFLEYEGRLLCKRGEEHYYFIRDRFNRNPTSLDFLFLSRAGFNGVMRFNRKGEFNVPFCRKPDRFRPAYITKIVNQIDNIARLITTHDWVFEVADWRDTLDKAHADDFVYADPPYAGRHTDYYNGWTADDAAELMNRLRALPCGFALSTWKENRYRTNACLENVPSDVVIKTFSHFYHVGSKEDYRNGIVEALVIKTGYSQDE